MCHSHDLSDLTMRVDMNQGELSISVAGCKCEYIIGLESLRDVMYTNPHRTDVNERGPGLLSDTDGPYPDEPCPDEPHTHTWPNLYKCELQRPYCTGWIEIAYHFCFCHVYFPISPVLGLVKAALDSDDYKAALHPSDMAHWEGLYEQVREGEDIVRNFARIETPRHDVKLLYNLWLPS